MLETLFKNLCPNCKEDISLEKLSLGLPCENCMPRIKENYCKHLKKTWRIKQSLSNRRRIRKMGKGI